MIDLQPVSKDIYKSKYMLHAQSGEPVETCVMDTFSRVAYALADVEETGEKRKLWYNYFFWAMKSGAIPAGRILSNAGAKEHKPNTSLINCVVSSTINDDMISILDVLKEAGLLLKSGCGIGYCFSTLRPRGAPVSGAGAKTSGPLPFIDVFDSLCKTISSAGGRRGAQMATFDVGHPDVYEFIKAKREDGRLRQFNLSLLVTDKFMATLDRDGDWPLAFGGTIYSTVKASHIWNLVMSSTYDYAEPGVLFVDRINEMNNLWFCENILAVNPCGEQNLPPAGSCLLGSVDLTKFVIEPFSDNARFDFDRFRKVVAIFARMLDNVVEIANLPVKAYADEMIRKRRHGMGYLGLGSAMAMLGMRYGDKSSLEFTDKVTKIMAHENWKQALELSIEKGPAPIMEETFAEHGSRGKTLHSQSMYMKRLSALDHDLVCGLARHGARFSHATSIAPTGTISLSVGNNASNGIEPSFAHEYTRNVIVEGKKSKESVKVYSLEALVWRDLHGDKPLPEHCVTADQVSPEEHIAVQAAAQKWIDSSISKTINVPSDISFERFKDIYRFAYKSGLKGCATFRFNPERFQGVLVKDDDLKNTIYRFDLESGDSVEFRGDETVEYEGELHTAANLFDAIKEGYYGKL